MIVWEIAPKNLSFSRLKASPRVLKFSLNDYWRGFKKLLKKFKKNFSYFGDWANGHGTFAKKLSTSLSNSHSTSPEKILRMVFTSFLIIFHVLWEKIFWNVWWKFFSLLVKISFCLYVGYLRRSTNNFEKIIQRTVFFQNLSNKFLDLVFPNNLSSELWNFQSFEPDELLGFFWKSFYSFILWMSQKHFGAVVKIAF